MFSAILLAISICYTFFLCVQSCDCSSSNAHLILCRWNAKVYLQRQRHQNKNIARLLLGKSSGHVFSHIVGDQHLLTNLSWTWCQCSPNCNEFSMMLTSRLKCTSKRLCSTFFTYYIVPSCFYKRRCFPGHRKEVYAESTSIFSKYHIMQGTLISLPGSDCCCWFFKFCGTHGKFHI